VDAGIIWDATARQYPELDLVEVPAFTNHPQRVAIGVLHNSRQPAAALRFARYLGAPGKGLRHFTDHGSQPVQGDAWEETPQVVLFSGGINRLAVEETIRKFEEREGVNVVRVYNGCGILVSQMKAGQQPDAYFACDTSFLTDVSDLFQAPLNISQSAIVLLVPKGNPLSLHTLADLAKPGLRVGVANEQQSALGALTVQLLKTQGLTEKVMANVKVQTPTADLLVNQIRTGSLDAVVVYEANTSQVRDTMSVVRLEGPGTTATQPYAVGRNSSHPLLMARLRNAIRSAQSRERFESVGFLWHADSRE
jgi:ABC-type molybdate transport system substrate-binding protein